MGWKEVGKVTRYFARISVAGVRLSDRLQIADHVHILGATSDFEQNVTSMELNHEPVEVAEKGQEIGLHVVKRARRGDTVYRVEEE
jgi:hypothetical protein